MERIESFSAIMSDQIKSRAAEVVQDLSKGVVPIVIVLALLAPAFWIGRGIESVKREQLSAAEKQAETASKVVEIQQDIKNTVTPLLYKVADIEAQVEVQIEARRIAERDLKLIETRLKNLEIESEARKLSGKR